MEPQAALILMDESSPLVSVIVVNHNGKKFLSPCFDSLCSINYPMSRLELIFVDNCSEDGSVKFVKERYPQIKIINNGLNNYCRALNKGIKAARGKYIATLNNDTKVEKPWLMELIKVIETDKTIAAVGSKILFMNGRINSVAHCAFPDYYWADLGFKEEDHGQYDKIAEVGSTCGASTLYRKKSLQAAGLFDEDFNMYLEDVEIGLRLKAMGLKTFYCPKSVVYHNFHGTASDELTVSYIERNRLLLVARHFPEHLGKSLMGSGYFAKWDNFKGDDIYCILPQVLSKLLKHHKDSFCGHLSDIFSGLRKIANLERHRLSTSIEAFQDRLNKKTEESRMTQSQLEQLRVAFEEKERESADKLTSIEDALKQKSLLLEGKEALLAEKEIRLRQSEGQLELLGLEIRKNSDLLAGKDAVISEKDVQLAQLHGELSGKNDELRLLEKENNASRLSLGQKEALIKEKDIELKAGLIRLAEKDNQLAMKEEELRQGKAKLSDAVKTLELRKSELDADVILLAERDRELDKREAEIKGLKCAVEQKERDIAIKQTEIASLKKDIAAFYSSETFIFFVRPLWAAARFFKNIKKSLLRPVFVLRGRQVTEKSRNKAFLVTDSLKKAVRMLKFINHSLKKEEITLCLGSFVTNLNTAHYEKSNQYYLRVTNHSGAKRSGKVVIDICSFDELSEERHASIVKRLSLEPKLSTEMKIEYDWKRSISLSTNGDKFGPDEFWTNDNEPREQHYVLRAGLYDESDVCKDRLEIFQKLLK